MHVYLCVEKRQFSSFTFFLGAESNEKTAKNIWNLELLNGANGSSGPIRIRVLFLSRFAIVRLLAQKNIVLQQSKTPETVCLVIRDVSIDKKCNKSK